MLSGGDSAMVLRALRIAAAGTMPAMPCYGTTVLLLCLRDGLMRRALLIDKIILRHGATFAYCYMLPCDVDLPIVDAAVTRRSPPPRHDAAAYFALRHCRHVYARLPRVMLMFIVTPLILSDTLLMPLRFAAALLSACRLPPALIDVLRRVGRYDAREAPMLNMILPYATLCLCQARYY